MASKPKINKMITKVNFSDSNRSAGQIKYLVKHFVGATGGAEANCRYFYDTSLCGPPQIKPPRIVCPCAIKLSISVVFSPTYPQ